jgi:hypothetical protein
MKRAVKIQKILVFIVSFIVFLLFIPLMGAFGAEEFWKLPPVPTIEELTDGKVKVGDTITKENVDLVKDLLPVSTYELVKQGLIMDIGDVSKPGELVPEFFRKATEASYEAFGKPVVDEKVVIYTKDGKVWPGGRPFPNPQNVLEIMANAKYGECMDDDDVDVQMCFVNRQAKAYKTVDLFMRQIWCNTRELLPPLGAIPGHEKEYKAFINVILKPRDLRGLGYFSIRHWDEVKHPDQGFTYLPAFKRYIRVSATTWQDNQAGSDMTNGDSEGLYEPYSYWQFKLIDTKPMLVSAPTEKSIRIPGTRNLDWSQFHGGTGGQRFHRDVWEVDNFYVIEATPKVEHIYSKKILYVCPDSVFTAIRAFDAYDLQGQLWKGMVQSRHILHPKGHPDQRFNGLDMLNFYDLQTGHLTITFGTHRPNVGINRSEFSLKQLIERGR